MQQAHEARFIVGTGPCHDFDFRGLLGGFIVGHGGKFGAGHNSVVAVLVGPQSHLSPDLACRTTRITGDNLHLHAGIAAVLDGGGHIRTHRVADSDDAQERERGYIARLEPPEHLVGLVGGIQFTIGERQRAHCLGLVIGQFVSNLGEGDISCYLMAHAHEYLGSALDQQQALAIHAVDDSGHHLGHGREGQLGQSIAGIACGHVVDARVAQPQQQGALGGIAQGHHISRVAVIQIGGAVAGNALTHEHSGIVVLGQFLSAWQAIEMGLIDLHLVLGERAGLVGTDDRGGAHGLAGMHTTHQVVVFQHLAHTQRQRQRHTHWQALGHRHHDKRDCQHHGLDKILGIGNQALAATDQELGQTAQHQQAGHHIAAAGNRVPQAVELLGERCLDIVVDLDITVNLSVFGTVPHPLDTHRGVTLDDGACTQQLVNGVSRLRWPCIGMMVFPCRRLAGEGTLVDGEVETVDEDTIGGHFLAGVQQDNVAHHDVATRHLGDMAVAHHFHVDMVIGLVEQAEFLVGIDLDDEAH